MSVEIGKNEIIIHDLEEAITILMFNSRPGLDLLLQTYGSTEISLSKIEIVALIAALQAMHDKMVDNNEGK